MAFRRSSLAAAACILAGRAWAAEPDGITRCQEGAEDILGSRKAYVVQVCNLFGDTCYMNHPSVGSSECATEALAIASGECKLYPIFEYEDWAVRSGTDAVEELSSEGDLGCSVSSSNSVYTWSGACVAVQCSLGNDDFAGPGMTGDSSSSRETGITDTATAAWTANTLAELPDEADQLKNVFLYRTGDYVATWYKAASGSSNSIDYSVGSLPTSDGNAYGPVVCPSTGNLLTSATATDISAAELRMCGSSGVGEWQYWNAVNLLMDATHYAQYSGLPESSPINIAGVPFLDGKSAYQSGTVMAQSRQVLLLDGDSSTDDVLMTSEWFEPATTGASEGETAGTWRSYGVVFYCDDYARTDLTACDSGNRKMFYVGDPNPDAEFLTSLGGGGDPGASAAHPKAACLSAPALTIASSLLAAAVAAVATV